MELYYFGIRIQKKSTINLVSIYLYFVITYLIIKETKLIKTTFFMRFNIMSFTKTFYIYVYMSITSPPF